MKQQLRETIEQYEASTEELRASNEELQAMNEELRSATEELELAREEQRFQCEELADVSAKLRSKAEELARTNSDLRNLLGSTPTATVFLDRELRITQYTPTALNYFCLAPSDLGRKLTDLEHSVDYDDLAADAEKVLRTLTPIDREVTDGQHWHHTTLRPYRTIGDRIAGTVLTIVELCERTPEFAK